jgi:hypothetical protein
VYDFRKVDSPIKALLEDKVVSISKRKSISRRLAAVIDRAISPKLEDRYPTATEMKEALEEAQN